MKPQLEFRVLNAIIPVCSMLLAGFTLYSNRFFYHDDAYITLCYVKNWLNGNGIVWNPGEYVQGYSNFLHLVLIFLFGKLGVDLFWASRIIGLAAFAGLVTVVWLFSNSLPLHVHASALRPISTILVLTATPMIVWSIGGLEGTLFSLLTTTGFCLLLATIKAKRNVWFFAGSAICLGLGFLTRPDGMLFILVSLIWLAFRWWRGQEERRNLLAFAVPILTIAISYVFWQISYYGDYVPTPVYAKTGSLSWHRLYSGLIYFLAYAFLPPYLPLLVTLSLVQTAVAKEWNPRLTLLSLLVSVYVSGIIFIGGDHMQSFRLLLPLIAPMSLMLHFSLSSLSYAHSRLFFKRLSIVIFLLSFMQLMSGKLNPRHEDPAALLGTIIGKYISNAWPKGSLVALNTAGSTPYHAPQHRFIDMLGLNDPHIAKRRVDKIELLWQLVPGHLKGDGPYVLSKNPEFIIIGPSHGSKVFYPLFLSDLEIGRDPRFEKHYRMVQVILNREGQWVGDAHLQIPREHNIPLLQKEPDEESRLVFTYYRKI